MTTSDDDKGDQPPTAAAADGDATTFVPPPTQVAPEMAWSAEDETEEIRLQSWRLTWRRAAVFGGVGAVIALAVGFGGGWALVQMHAKEANRRPPVSTNVAPTPASKATDPAPPPAQTVTVTTNPAPPATVTVTPPPPAPIVTVEASPPPDTATAHTDIFTICPDGHEGVVGGHTTCAFAENVRRTFYTTGMPNNFTAFSPVTGDAYQMTCVGRYPAYFSDGSTMTSTRCYGGDDAEVVIW
jgi:hypothetical protein